MISIWLIFSDKDQQSLCEQIDDLSQRHSGPKFLPHITLYGFLEIEIKRLTEITDRCFNKTKKFNVHTTGIGQTDNIWKTVFIKIITDSQLVELYEFLTTELEQFRSYDFNPHVSLMYRKMPVEKRILIAQEINFAPHYEITGATLLETSVDVNSWRILKRYNFL
ncbi:MAG: 2'-5' RNA ligase family protein [Candidatus Marinimicrobia bacterium]|nr:2'-5' RNA ligase family protein [Candidatus Neomarinimicrobiota bacterium]